MVSPSLSLTIQPSGNANVENANPPSSSGVQYGTDNSGNSTPFSDLFSQAVNQQTDADSPPSRPSLPQTPTTEENTTEQTPSLADSEPVANSNPAPANQTASKSVTDKKTTATSATTSSTSVSPVSPAPSQTPQTPLTVLTAALTPTNTPAPSAVVTASSLPVAPSANAPVVTQAAVLLSPTASLLSTSPGTPTDSSAGRLLPAPGVGSASNASQTAASPTANPQPTPATVLAPNPNALITPNSSAQTSALSGTTIRPASSATGIVSYASSEEAGSASSVPTHTNDASENLNALPLNASVVAPEQTGTFQSSSALRDDAALYHDQFERLQTVGDTNHQTVSPAPKPTTQAIPSSPSTSNASARTVVQGTPNIPMSSSTNPAESPSEPLQGVSNDPTIGATALPPVLNPFTPVSVAQTAAATVPISSGPIATDPVSINPDSTSTGLDTSLTGIVAGSTASANLADGDSKSGYDSQSHPPPPITGTLTLSPLTGTNSQPPAMTGADPPHSPVSPGMTGADPPHSPVSPGMTGADPPHSPIMTGADPPHSPVNSPDGNQRSEIMSQVTQHLQNMRLTNGQGEISINLQPDSLGSLRLTISAHADGVVAKVVAETAQTQHAVEGAKEQLRAALENRGMRLNSLDVSLGQGSPSDGRSAFASQQGTGQEPTWTTPTLPTLPTDSTEEIAPASVTSMLTPTASTSRLDYLA